MTRTPLNDRSPSTTARLGAGLALTGALVLLGNATPALAGAPGLIGAPGLAEVPGLVGVSGLAEVPGRLAVAPPGTELTIAGSAVCQGTVWAVQWTVTNDTDRDAKIKSIMQTRPQIVGIEAGDILPRRAAEKATQVTGTHLVEGFRDEAALEIQYEFVEAPPGERSPGSGDSDTGRSGNADDPAGGVGDAPANGTAPNSGSAGRAGSADSAVGANNSGTTGKADTNAPVEAASAPRLRAAQKVTFPSGTSCSAVDAPASGANGGQNGEQDATAMAEQPEAERIEDEQAGQAAAPAAAVPQPEAVLEVAEPVAAVESDGLADALPVTGGQAALLAGAAGLLMIAGGVAVITARRRRVQFRA